jgi:hypothetical protein
LTVTDKVGEDGTDTLLNIERLQFSDRSILADGGLSLKEPSTANSATHDPAADFTQIGDASTDEQPIAGASSGKALAPDPLHSEPSPHPLSFGQGDVILA